MPVISSIQRATAGARSLGVRRAAVERLAPLAAGIMMALCASLPVQASESERSAKAVEADNRRTELAWVIQNKETFVGTLVNQWQPEATRSGASATWAAEFAQALRATTPERLIRIKAAASYVEVRAILQGRKAPVNLRASGIQDLGDLSEDLTFTPVNPPCRIFDSRNYGGGVPPPGGSTRNYWVHGPGTTTQPQGGNPAGCTAPKGEPVGIAANFTIANPSGTGHIRVYPFGGSVPTVSFVNFTANSGSVANAGIVSTCYLCGFDLSVFNAVTVHHIGDVMGYFYPADIGGAIQTAFGGYDIAAVMTVPVATIAYPGVFVGSSDGSSTITVDAGDEVMWSSSALVWRSSGATNQIRGAFKGCYRNASTGVITEMPLFHSETDFIFPSNGLDQQHSVNVAARESSMPAAGTYEFGFCAINGNSYGGPFDAIGIGAQKHSVIKIRR